MQSGTLGLVRRHQEAAENVGDLYSLRTSDFNTTHDAKPPMQRLSTEYQKTIYTLQMHANAAPVMLVPGLSML